MGIEISSHFSYRKLMRLVFPSIATMIFLSTYSIIDGFFVSNYVGDRAFAAINLIFPALGIFGCVGAVIGAGGSALIGKRLGQQRIEEACSLFSLLSLAGLAIGFVLAACAWCVMPWIASGMGAEGGNAQRKCFLWANPADFISYASAAAHLSFLCGDGRKTAADILD